MIGATVIFGVTIVVSLLGLYAAPQIIDKAILRPYRVQRNGEYFRLVSSGFIHADLAHLAFNMFTFYFFAFAIERYIGTSRFLLLYFAGLITSSVGTAFSHRNDPNYASLGASGAILAVMFAAIVYFPHQKLIMLFFPVPIPAPLFAVCYLAYSFYASRHSKGRINHDAHIAGAITGLIFVALTDPFAYRELAGMLGFPV
jgi:membrane associated rhomboid family serine protease